MKPLFADTGLHVLCDGQFGSTGKGLFASYLAAQHIMAVDAGKTGRMVAVLSNAGPNSGHTFYHNDRKIVLKQLPTFAVASLLLGHYIPVYLTAGAIIDPEILLKEVEEFPCTVYINPNAAVITAEDKAAEADLAGSIAAVAGTRSGTGAALARKVLRQPQAVAGQVLAPRGILPPHVRIGRPLVRPHTEAVFMEISQGFSLGLNQPFYPKCTSRECTVAQGIADAGLTPRAVSRVYMTIRTFPIRVGDVDGHSSGRWYPDQKELDWSHFPGVEPERTTVTQRIRRIATFSEMQYADALRANDPDFVLVNFMNYVPEGERENFRERVWDVPGVEGIPARPELLFGYGPKVGDVRYG